MTTYNKVTIDGTTLMDLSQDTVASASHIRSGYIGHLNDGTQVTGSYSGGGSIPKNVISGSSVSQELTENEFYVFGTMTSLTITLATPADANIINEYHFRFTSGSTATVLTLPNSVTMPSGFQVEASKVYEISIIDNYGTVSSW